MDMQSNIILICFYDEICVVDLTGNVLFWRDEINYLTKFEADKGYLRVIGLGCDFISKIANNEDFIEVAIAELKLKTKQFNKKTYYNTIWEKDILNSKYTV